MKKRYIIIALVIVSLLFGSLLYANVVLSEDIIPSGKPQPSTHTDSVKIEVLHWTDRIYLYDDFTIRVPFSFVPEQTFQGVVDLWATITIESPMTYKWNYTFNLTLNDEIELCSGLLSLPPFSFSMPVSLHVTDSNVLQTLHQGMNTIEISDPYRPSLSNPSVLEPHAMYIREIAVFITYEYEA